MSMSSQSMVMGSESTGALLMEHVKVAVSPLVTIWLPGVSVNSGSTARQIVYHVILFLNFETGRPVSVNSEWFPFL